MRANIQVAATEEEWIHLAVKTITNQATQAIQNRGFFSLVLSGGNTPKPVYQALASDYIQAMFDWSKWFIFWGDERCVPPNDDESNFRMAKLAFLDQTTIPQKNIHRMMGEIDPINAAQLYEEEINKFFLKKEKRFDTILLGVGNDGHTASLFPGVNALQEKKHWVSISQHPDSGMKRITLTYPAINQSRNIIFLVKGSEKSNVIADIINNPNNDPHYPAKGITGKENPPEWIIDTAAAGKLKI